MGASQQAALPDIRKHEIFAVPVERAWAAVATSDGIAAWFMPNDFEPLLGQRFTLDAGPWGVSECEVTELHPLQHLAFRWGQTWSIRFELAKRGQQTEFTLIHSGWDAGKTTEFGEDHAIVRDRMDMGWSGLVTRLKEYVESL